MPGTRTAPTVDGSPTFHQVTLHWMDFTSDKRADTYRVDAAATDVEIEAFAATMQLLSNATLYKVSVGEVYNSVPDGTTNALEEVWENVKDNLVVQAKNVSDDSERVFVPSTINAVFLDGTETIDPANIALGNMLTAWVALLPAGFDVVGARFTHRKQVNQQIKF